MIYSSLIKYIAPFVDLIHGVESLKVLKEINKQALKHQRIIDCLLQIKIASEDSKFGMTASEAIKILTSQEINDLKNIHIVGLMGMASFTEDQDQIRNEFHQLRSTFKALKELRAPHTDLSIISMGMSGDYPIAIDCGSTMIRVGSSIFGRRN